MRRMILMLLLLMALSGCDAIGDALSEPTRTPAPTETPFVIVPIATNVPVLDSEAPSTIVLDGSFTYGGYWTWDEIALLMQEYAEAAEPTLTPATVDEQTYSGVPFPFLLQWSGMRETAFTMAIIARNGERFDFPPRDMLNCFDCILVLAPDNSITLVAPEYDQPLVAQIARIEVR